MTVISTSAWRLSLNIWGQAPARHQKVSMLGVERVWPAQPLGYEPTANETVKIKTVKPNKAQTLWTPFPLAEAQNQSPINTASTAAKRHEQARAHAHSQTASLFAWHHMEAQ